MKKPKGKKCIVKECPNRTSEGRFIGDICVPCWMKLKHGRMADSKKVAFEWLSLAIVRSERRKVWMAEEIASELCQLIVMSEKQYE